MSISVTDVPHEGTVGLEIDAENSVINFNENIYIIGGKLFISEEQHDLEMKLFLGKYRGKLIYSKLLNTNSQYRNFSSYLGFLKTI